MGYSELLAYDVCVSVYMHGRERARMHVHFFIKSRPYACATEQALVRQVYFARSTQKINK